MEDEKIGEETRPQERPIVEQNELGGYGDPDIIRWGCYHAVVHCRDCDFEDEDWRTAQQSARQHGDETGHKMTLEVGYITNDNYWWGYDKPDLENVR